MLYKFLFSLPVFLISIVIHEYAHGWVAYKLGDPTAKYAGRLTLNPIAHIDPVGTVVLPLFLLMMRSPVVFGWAKPVPITYSNLRNPKKDILWVGLAGPASNLGLAFISSLLLKAGIFASVPLVKLFLFYAILINLILAVFNAIPVPPLDGSRILLGLLPPEFAASYARLEPYGILILFGLMWLGLIHKVIWPAVLYLAALLGIGGW